MWRIVSWSAVLMALLGGSAAVGEVRINSATVSDDEVQLKFDQAMLTWTSPVELRELSIEPALDCRWRWDDDTTLTCTTQPDAAPAQQATRYSVSVHGGLWSQSGEQVTEQIVYADSDLPEIEASVAEWNDGEPRIVVMPNQPIDAVELRRAIDVRGADGGAAPFHLEAEKPQQFYNRKDIVVPQRIVFDDAAGSSGVVHVAVHPGLVGKAGLLPGTQDEVLVSAYRNEPFRFRGWTCSNRLAYAKPEPVSDPNRLTCTAGSRIAVELSEKPDPVALAHWARRLPGGLRLLDDREASPYSFRPESIALGKGWYLALSVERARRKFSVRLDGDLLSADRKPLSNAVDLQLTTTDFPAEIKIEQSRSVLLPSAKLPTLGYRRNVENGKLYQYSLGAGGIDSVSSDLRTRRRNRVYPLTVVEPPSDEIRRNGGLLFGLAGTAYGSSFALAYAPIHIVALQSPGQLLVWASSWDGYASIEGAQVELLGLKAPETLQTIAHGITDSDGTSVLEIPALARYGGSFLLRVEHAGQRSVLPLVDRYAGASWAPVPEAAGVAWGVTDKPLYRPGDTVKYRVWLRQRSANRLVRPSLGSEVTLKLDNEYRSGVLQQWNKRAEPDGSLSGELQLPPTIADSRYCIQVDGYSENTTTGACFDLSNFHASALWAEVTSAQTLAYDGDTVAFDVTAGYYSGGAASGARAEPQSLLTPLRLEEAFPEFSEYTFIDPNVGTEADGGESFSAQMPRIQQLDQFGKARISFILHNNRLDRTDSSTQPIPYGKLEITSSVSNSAASYTTSSTASFRVSRYRRFVGLMSDQELSAETDPVLTAVVIDAEGRIVANAGTVDIAVSSSPAHRDVWDRSDELAQEVFAHCQIPVGTQSACAFRAPKQGMYRFTATQEGAAPSTIDRFVTADHKVEESEPSEARLERIGDQVVSTEFVLHQPYNAARVLFSVEHGRVLKHWIATVDAQNSPFHLDLPTEWAPGVRISALVLKTDGGDLGDAVLKNGERDDYRTASLDVAIPRPASAPALLIDVPKAPIAPGGEVEIRLNNRSGQAIDVTLAVVDEAVRMLAPEIQDLQDPGSESWLGLLENWSTPDGFAFVNWKLVRPDAAGLVLKFGAIAPSPDDADGKLESIVVTGSRIRAVDLFVRGGKPDRTLKPNLRTGQGLFDKNTARQNFADSAYWQPSIAIPAGASHSVRFRLPDNLTRWQVLAWSVAGDDDFRLDQASFSASLPVEVRAELPVRLFPGDRSDIALGVRNHGDVARTLSAQLDANGSGMASSKVSTATVLPDRELRVRDAIAPTQAGSIEVTGAASAGKDRDSVLASVEVASSIGHERVALAGWVDESTSTLHLPPLPESADDVQLQITVRRNLDGLVEDWITALHDYPHRCWEQQLGRAIGAAAALRLGKAQKLWPDAEALVSETLRGAAVYQEDGLFRFFAEQSWSNEPTSPLLSAYSVRGLETLRDWGHPLPDGLIDSVRGALQLYLQGQAAPLMRAHELQTRPERRDWAVNSTVLAALAGEPKNDALIGEAFSQWDKLDWYARSQLLLAPGARVDKIKEWSARLDQLGQATELRAGRRVLHSSADRSDLLGSDLRDQCSLIDTLNRLEAPVALIDEWQRGLVDLYAGGMGPVDTQAGAQCLMSLLALQAAATTRQPAAVQLDAKGISQKLRLAADADSTQWSGAVPAGATQFQIHADAGGGPLSYVAEVSYRIDQRLSTANNSGLAIGRDYAVLRNGEWQPSRNGVVQAGDWVRVHLRVDIGATRHHVAVVDSVPGGLRPEDLQLDRVAGIGLRNADVGTPWFDIRQLHDTNARFYADHLPPGSHDIYYYARAMHQGDFLALPARAELMYGRASVARTAAARMRVTASAIQ